MAVSDIGRLSVSLVDIIDGREEEFLRLSREFEALVAAKGYGRVEIIRDEGDARRFYAVRHWASASAAEACHADREVQVVTGRIYEVSRVTHVVNGVRRGEALRLLLDDRRVTVESDRRAGFDRRTRDAGRPEGDRRTGRDRRLGPRRFKEHTGPFDLLAAARRARENADAAFSHFKVGAALETADGTVVTGCNIENATYGLTICAERVAMFKALSDGHRGVHPHRDRRRHRRTDAALRRLPPDPVGVRRQPRGPPRQPRGREGRASPQGPAAAALRRPAAWAATRDRRVAAIRVKIVGGCCRQSRGKTAQWS